MKTLIIFLLLSVITFGQQEVGYGTPSYIKSGATYSFVDTTKSVLFGTADTTDQATSGFWYKAWNSSVQLGGSTGLYWDNVNKRLAAGTTSPNEQFEITKNFRLPATTYNGGNKYGVIYKDGNRFIHDFNYGNNGTVTTTGYNIFVGINAGNFTMGSTATQTYQASYNTGIGYQSLNSNTTGSYNTANGVYSLNSNTTGSYNTANGVYSLNSNTTGSYNIANGYGSLYSNTAGSYNTANGYGSLSSNTTGYNNTANGYNAGAYILGGANPNQTSNTSVYLGADTKAYADGDANEIVIGYNATGGGSNTVTLGNTSIDTTYLQGRVYFGGAAAYVAEGGTAIVAVSDTTRKYDIIDLTNWHIDKFKDVVPIRFKYKPDVFYRKPNYDLDSAGLIQDSIDQAEANKKSLVSHIGFSAQEIGLITGEANKTSIGQDELIIALWLKVRELEERIEVLEAK